ncbi:unnamed protein product [Ostreobium quekettii]|uniref:Protein phosphatase n=1 Tax=Ostreobium quekettii TaxID=121088 RepID=A0A8S1ILK6_9CHLO|nr:unnamed protein product [Ostreobium quekettii]
MPFPGREPNLRDWACAAAGRKHTMQHRGGGGGVGDVSAKGSASEQLCAPREVKFIVPVRVNYGDSVKVVGNESALGGWDYDRGIPLQWSEGNIWTNKVDLNPGAYEFKCVVGASDGGVQWEPGNNRSLNVHPEMSQVEVCCEWWDTQKTCSSPGGDATLEYMQDKLLPMEMMIVEEPKDKEFLDLPSAVSQPPDGKMVDHLFLGEDKQEDADDCTIEPTINGTENDARPPEHPTSANRDALSLADRDSSLASGAGSTPDVPAIVRVENHVVATPADFPVLKEVLGLVAAGHIAPHFAKRKKGGEDAYFVSTAGLGGIGVADGVGSWASDGVDPARYPRVLIGYIAKALNDSDGTVSAQGALEYAQQQAHVLGSCTACVGLLREAGMMEIANLGDCGFRIIREGCVVHASKVQQHNSNHPFQLSHPTLAPGDSAADAELYEVPVEDGDIVVMGTDGLFHNFWDHDLGPFVGGLCGGLQRTETGARSIATSIAEAAHRNAMDHQFYSPWSAESQAQVCQFSKDVAVPIVF